MINSKEDRRIRITKLAIKESLVELMQTNPISKISVKMICDAADINRSTFYAHYQDQYDLLTKIEKEVITDIKEHVLPISFIEQSVTALSMFTQMLEYVKANAPLFKVLLSGNGDASFQNELMYLGQEKLIEELSDENQLDPRVMKYLELYAISGVESIVYKWVTDGCIDETDKLSEMIFTLLLTGARGFYK
ncbi:MAG: TetR-like C-terminal domain-containing protein [Anaerolineaceae bacterium]|jgi:AcrR family transcriptional regulator|nr:TetR-like C-terminal domain-containing protein [Anaerolineaceae bacterium]